uniref:Uncharacterized protein n=1 Tax=Corethron hystrix TaxID=216773 RepID=A0A7S1FR27_9STRA|mmetsp:Transcript_220/g.489  ORF Transcript_220/g.489 Transcript_220/m.489 type:complete len:164 (+) Transcript_220:166-657(+)
MSRLTLTSSTKLFVAIILLSLITKHQSAAFVPSILRLDVSGSLSFLKATPGIQDDSDGFDNDAEFYRDLRRAKKPETRPAHTARTGQGISGASRGRFSASYERVKRRVSTSKRRTRIGWSSRPLSRKDTRGGRETGRRKLMDCDCASFYAMVHNIHLAAIPIQ